MKENVYREPELAGETQPKKKKWKLKLPLKSFFSGDWYLVFQKNFAFTLFMTGVGLIYIWNAHTAENQARKAEKLLQELKELKSEYMTLNADLSKSRKQSEMIPVVDTLGLKPLKEPPYKLVVARGKEAR